MDKNIFTNWFHKLGKSWSALNPHEAAHLFSKDVEYYESVFNHPCSNWDEVLNLWKVIPHNQKEVTFRFEIIATEENTAVANWQVIRVLVPSNQKQTIDGIFVIKLNKEGYCNYFKQWRMLKEM